MSVYIFNWRKYDYWYSIKLPRNRNEPDSVETNIREYKRYKNIIKTETECECEWTRLHQLLAYSMVYSISIYT